MYNVMVHCIISVFNVSIMVIGSMSIDYILTFGIDEKTVSVIFTVNF